MHTRTKKVALLTGLLALVMGFSVKPALAGKPMLDSGLQLDTTKPYEGLQVISDVYANKGVYGKLEGGVPVDIYKFTPDRDGEQTFSLLVKPQDMDRGGSPALIIVDKTDATKDEQLQLPLPEEGYHTALLSSVENRTYFDAGLMAKYAVVAEQKLTLKKDTDYYLIVLDQRQQVTNYVIRLGAGRPWTFGDVFKNIGAWFQIKTDSYAGTSPFTFDPKAVGMIIYTLGLSAFFGMWLVLQIFTFMANRSKPAAYLLVKLQPFSRITLWIGLWFWMLGGYIFFNRLGWFGLPFVLVLIFFGVLVLNLIHGIVFSPRLAKLEVSKKEATIPLRMRKQLFLLSVLDIVLIGGYLTLSGMYFVK